MAEVSFDTLEALARNPVPSETDASIVSGYRRWVSAATPIKIEYNFYQQGDGDNFAALDTFVSGLARPFAASVELVNVDSANTDAGHPSAELEGVESDANFRRVTVHDADTTADAGIIVKVYGF
jgi:hypothetical protein